VRPFRGDASTVQQQDAVGVRRAPTNARVTLSTASVSVRSGVSRNALYP
jgi:hypothetical protein